MGTAHNGRHKPIDFFIKKRGLLTTLQDMRNARFIPSIKDYTAVISTVGKVGKWKLALQACCSPLLYDP